MIKINQMHYDYIEVGTSDFDTLYETAPAHHHGLSIEPISQYLDAFKGVASDTKIKVNAALVVSKTEDTAPIYFVDEHKHPEYTTGMFHWVRGSNSMFKPHPIVSEKVPAYAVSVKQVPVYTWSEVFEKFAVTSVDMLKLDVEGLDVSLMDAYCEYMEKHEQPFFPKNIMFECWTWTLKESATEKLLERLKCVGYECRIDTINNHVSNVYGTYTKN